MSNKKWNQYKNQVIRSADDKPDTTKLVNIINLLRKKYPNATFKREPFLVFDFLTGAFVFMGEQLTAKQLEERFFHRTDIVIFYKKTQLIIEIDGNIHNIKTENTFNRNADYLKAKLDYMIIDEEELKLRKQIPKSNKLTPEQIANEIIRKIKEENRLPMA